MIDPVELTADLIRCPSVTPEEGGAIALLERLLAPLGFACTRISRGGIENLYAVGVWSVHRHALWPVKTS